MRLNSSILAWIRTELDQANAPFVYSTFPCMASVDILSIAANANITPSIYFSKPNQTEEYVSFGAWRLLTNSDLKKMLQKIDFPIRYFGINAFATNTNLPKEYWVMPIMWLEKTSHGTQIHVLLDLESNSKEDAFKQLDAVNSAINFKSNLSTNQTYQTKTHSPTQDGWLEIVNKAQDQMTRHQIEKVVLARQTTFKFINQVNPFLLLKNVQKKDNGVYNFCIKSAAEHSFIGGTPERLFEINSNIISSDAIAGTLFKPEGANVSHLKHQLLTSQKNIGEHQYVVDFIDQKLKGLCTSVIVDENRSLIELKYLLHLMMHFQGHLSPGNDWLTAIQALHPTPAVGGVPAEDALRFIKENEPFDRGWYAGPMGTITKDEAHIVVAIRSGSVIGDKVILSAGAGIVSDSDPMAEWDELNAKISLFTSIFSETQ
ncbi:MAG: isochorismate synthase [Candidatus Margulisiibacteriota bacterium]